MRISEPDLVLPALLVISSNPGIATGNLREELEKIFRPSGEDAEILANRSDSKFTQMVRNLVSHETLSREGLAQYTERQDTRGGTFVITGKGQDYLNRNRQDLVDLLENGFPYAEVVSSVRRMKHQSDKKGKTEKRENYVDENEVITEGEKTRSESARYKRSRAVRDAAIAFYKDKSGRIACAVCGFDFQQVYGALGQDFIEIHHEHPLFLGDGEAEESTVKEAISKVKPLCPNCHRMIHRRREEMLSVEELKETIEGTRKS